MFIKGKIAAERAAYCATNKNSDGFLKLSSQMCWDAVVTCAFDSKGISEAKNPTLKSITSESFSHFVSMDDPVISSREEMWKVPQGSFLGFFSLTDGKPKLIHGMLATGAGCAAGNKNGCIGLGSPVGWEILDLANNLIWLPEMLSFNAVHKNAKGVQNIRQIRYRTLDKFL
ncbi:hypothetical protein [Psychromonas aquimarina]|uniref:hypothetical protein n=1 Tax=Psychromonas aquimarina TaxID=444919 RepID=UPI0004123C99|nr:hypothetical protein [Psychromonas aquimarina]